MSSTLLQIFLLLIVFCIGVCSTLAVQYALAHLHYKKHGHQPEHDKPTDQKAIELSAEMKQHLMEKSQANFQAALDKAAVELEHDLDKTAGELNAVLQKIGTQVVGSEMERYKAQLEDIRSQTTGAIGNAQQEIAKHQAELTAKLHAERAELQAKLQEEEAALRAGLQTELLAEKQKQVQQIMAEKEQLMQQIDTRLADAVASFLIETLGHNVDLGAQQAYLTAQLEEHKEDFKREVAQ